MRISRKHACTTAPLLSRSRRHRGSPADEAREGDKPDARNDDLRVDVTSMFLENISDIRWAESGVIPISAKFTHTRSCVVPLCSTHYRRYSRRGRIFSERKETWTDDELNGVSDVYMATLIRLRALRLNRWVLRLKVLTWVLYRNGRYVRRILVVLGVETGSAGLDPEKIDELTTLLLSSQCCPMA